MSYTINFVSAIPSTGSIMSYLGTTDPDGWILCDGVNRTSVDSRYSNLSTLLNTIYGISTNTANSITPPNLTGKFLYGATTTTTGIGQTGGSATQILTLPTHSHTFSGTTTATNTNHSHNSGWKAANGPGGSGWTEGFQGIGTSVNTGTAVTVAQGSSGVNHSHTFSQTTVSTGQGQAISILPPYTIINYIIKY